MNNFASMMKNGNMPDDMKNFINNIKNSNSNNTNTSNNSENVSDNENQSSNNINPEMLKNIMNMFNNTNNSGSTNTSYNSNESNNYENSSNSDSSNGIPNFDFNMLLKMKSIMDKMNSNGNDPRSNLLHSLKPYLRESRKNKVEQYVQLFNMTKIIDVFNKNGGEKSK